MSIGPAWVAAASRARITASASRSAFVTGDPSALRSRPIRRLPKYPRMTGAASLRGLDRSLQQFFQLSFRHRDGRINDLSYDLLVIGGGIHGAGIARDAAGRGLSVLLVEKDGLAAHTSSASSKLVHGGLRYLEYFHLRLVRESLMERERLLAIAPHLVERRRFVLPYRSRLRPAWAVRLGLFLYDWMGRRSTLGPSEGVHFAESPYGRPLRPALRFGFAYTDCTTDDSRLVILNAKDAAERGADIRVGHRLVSATREGKAWRAEIRDDGGGAAYTVAARAIVNAAGPWVGEVLQGRLGAASARALRLVKGSHIVVPRLYEGEQAYALQHADRRLVFVIPYLRDFTLVGTTDVPWSGEPGPPTSSRWKRSTSATS